jgi:hypothetical protein
MQVDVSRMRSRRRESSISLYNAIALTLLLQKMVSQDAPVIRSAPLLPDSFGRRPWALQWHAPLPLQAFVLAFAVAVLLFHPAPALAQLPQRWTLLDQAGRSWSLTLFEQADPDFPGGLRVRLTDRTGSMRVDHRRPLQLRDGLGGAWELASRSAELVPSGVDDVPAGSAQFDLAGLQPAPRAEIPLAMAIPLEGEEEAQLVAGPDVVAELHGVASGRQPVGLEG